MRCPQTLQQAVLQTPTGDRTTLRAVHVLYLKFLLLIYLPQNLQDLRDFRSNKFLLYVSLNLNLKPSMWYISLKEKDDRIYREDTKNLYLIK